MCLNLADLIQEVFPNHRLPNLSYCFLLLTIHLSLVDIWCLWQFSNRNISSVNSNHFKFFEILLLAKNESLLSAKLIYWHPSEMSLEGKTVCLREWIPINLAGFCLIPVYLFVLSQILRFLISQSDMLEIAKIQYKHWGPASWNKIPTYSAGRWTASINTLGNWQNCVYWV